MNSVYNNVRAFTVSDFLWWNFRQNRKLKTNRIADTTESDNRCSCFAYRKDLMKLTDTPAPDSILISSWKKNR